MTAYNDRIQRLRNSAQYYQQGGGEMALSELSKQQVQQTAQEQAEFEALQLAQELAAPETPPPHSSTPEEEPLAAPEIGPKRVGRQKKDAADE